VAVLADLARTLGLPCVVTNNVHYAAQDGHRLQDTLVAIRHNVTLDRAQSWLRPTSEYYLKTEAEIRDLFGDYPQAMANTVEIAARCQVDLDLRREAIPPPPDCADVPTDDHLASLCQQALPRLYRQNQAAARRQLAHELDVIRQTRLAGYFILVRDIVQYAKDNGIEVRGRGSAASSIVSYLLGITHIDPLAHNLLFERFLSTDVRVMPDIDLDLCSRRREEVIQHIYETYGAEHVGMVCNYVTYRQRSAVRDVGKALGFPPELLARLSKGLRVLRSADITETTSMLELIPEGISNALWARFLDLCAQIRGLPRHLSIHVGGMCITRVPLDTLVPLERATMPGRVVTQWNKDGIEDAGLIKLDILSLRTLSAIDDCLTMIEDTRGVRLELNDLPLDDPQVYAALQRADTIGAFQVESRAQQQSLVRSRPACLEDIVVQVALIRPGPIQGNMVNPYLQRRQGLEPVRYLHPMLEPILKETLGVVVFQEQVIRIAMVMGCFSAGEADLLRRAMSRNRTQGGMLPFRIKFVAGAVGQGVPPALAEEIFGKLEGFASYGFCKSHAAAFARTAYDTLYLRAYYAPEYYCSLLNNQPMGFYAPRVLLGDARRHGVRIAPVDINLSDERCTVQGDQIRLGFIYVDGLGEETIERLLDARQTGPFVDLDDLCRRTRLPRRLVENLILGGALDGWSPKRRALLWRLGRLRYKAEELPLILPPDGVSLPPMTRAERLLTEMDILGVSPEGHVMELLRDKLEASGVLSSQEIEALPEGTSARVAGMVVIRQRPATAKGFVFLTLEDEYGLMNVVVRPNIYQAQRIVWSTGHLLIVQGTIERNREQINMVATAAAKLDHI
jgi:error-prone DNA polymerase